MNTVNIVAASNNLYVPYLSVMLQSVKNYGQYSRKYSVTILHTDIAKENQDILANQLQHSKIKVEFINVSKIMSNYSNLFISNHIKIETYFRLLLPDLMPSVEKVLYIDCDVIANYDVAELFDIDIEDYFLVGTRDADSAANYINDEDYHNYLDDVIKLENPYDYMQAGIIVMNLKKFRKECSTAKLLKTALSRNWRFHDQDTLNYLCKGKIKFIDYAWNFVYDYNEGFRRSKEILPNAPHYIYQDYLKAKRNPKMIHFSWVDKPWFSPGVHFGEKWWMIARQTPYYSELLLRTEKYLAEYIINQR